MLSEDLLGEHGEVGCDGPTGVIGRRYPMDRVRAGVASMPATPSGRSALDVATGIMTTDTFAKVAEATVGDGPARVVGVAKGVGMIEPHMATLITMLFTDADVPAHVLRTRFRLVIDRTFNCVSVDTDTKVLVAKDGELPVHGIAMRPSSPTGMGRIGHRLIFLLPGNPVSALCAYDFFAGGAIRALGGRPITWPYRSYPAILGRKISSPIGRLDYVRVKFKNGQLEPLSVSGASVLSSTTRADGFVIVDDDSEGFAAGSTVDVWLYA